ncbi:hypothetical protein EGT74_27090 [Chitinophaga lutea]|uniref:Uncharacterized protein n=1 Tax=Chitinophaga lutea TaxID=2488634 RepID=A0A3N4PNX2_9BACT|nr:hypothetical protein [Chitinophaga lutea]RPE06017.1 hypothetical protein EGT74_27090 [Chitinophaga lutea]
MDIIAYQDFHNIRLSDFYAGPDYREVENYDFMGEQWIGELSGFNTFLRLISEPEDTKSISLDFTKDEQGITGKVLEALHLPIKNACTESDLVELFGEPHKKLRLAKDTVTMDYIIGDRYTYYLSCTLHHINGLMYLDIMNEEKVIKKLKSKDKKKKEA